MYLAGLTAKVRDVWSRTSAAPVLASLVALLLAGPWVPPAHARSASALYYETETSAGRLAIDRLSLSGPRSITQVVELGHDVNVFAIALAGSYVYWSTEAGPRDRGAIMRATLDGRNVRRLVGGLPAPASLIAVGGFVYWSDANAVGRMALDGSHLRRRFIVLPQEPGGGVADGLASEGTHLYFTRCTDDTIGRVGLNGRHIDRKFVSLGPRSCPQGISAGGGHLYWTELGSGTIGRATLTGHDVDGGWLHIHSTQGPFQVAADTAHVYWTWGGVTSAPDTGRADANGTHIDPRFLADSLYPMALAGAS
jgi:virginiamycin B lyase